MGCQDPGFAGACWELPWAMRAGQCCGESGMWAPENPPGAWCRRSGAELCGPGAWGRGSWQVLPWMEDLGPLAPSSGLKLWTLSRAAKAISGHWTLWGCWGWLVCPVVRKWSLQGPSVILEPVKLLELWELTGANRTVRWPGGDRAQVPVSLPGSLP